jgi:hypothetical protein
MRAVRREREQVSPEWRELAEIFALLAERGRRLRLAQKQTASPDEPLTGSTGKAGHEEPSQEGTSK